MSKINDKQKIILAILALIFGISFRLFIWNPNTQTVVAYDDPENLNATPPDFSTPFIVQNANTDINNTIVIDTTQKESNVTEINMVVKKYMSSSEDGPWVNANTPAGSSLDGDYVFWKIEVTNRGEVALDLSFIDYYDGYLLDVENYAQLPEKVEIGETIFFTYKMHTFSGIHYNEVIVSGTHDNTTIIDTDKAYYNGGTTDVRFELDENNDIPKFVVPEYPLGVLGGLISLISAFVLSKRRY